VRFAHGALYTFGTRVALAASALLTGIIIAQVLEPEGRGAYSLAVLVPVMLYLVGNLGLGISNVYFASKEKKDVPRLAGNSILFSVLAAILLLLVFAFFYGYFEPFLRGVNGLSIILAVSILPFYFVYNFFQNLLLGMKKITEYNVLRLVDSGFLISKKKRLCGDCLLVALDIYPGGGFSYSRKKSVRH